VGGLFVWGGGGGVRGPRVNRVKGHSTQPYMSQRITAPSFSSTPPPSPPYPHNRTMRHQPPGRYVVPPSTAPLLRGLLAACEAVAQDKALHYEVLGLGVSECGGRVGGRHGRAVRK
jgi:hypothetical protein